MFTIYILQSLKDKRTYAGFTENMDLRLSQHNAGKVTATKNRRPFIIIYTEKATDIAEAKRRELYWKSGGGRRQLVLFFKLGFPPIANGRGSPK